MLYLQSLTPVINTLVSEFSRLGTYLDAYPVVYMIIALSVIIDAVIFFGRLIKL